jgi:hypothetical protein
MEPEAEVGVEVETEIEIETTVTLMAVLMGADSAWSRSTPETAAKRS